MLRGIRAARTSCQRTSARNQWRLADHCLFVCRRGLLFTQPQLYPIDLAVTHWIGIEGLYDLVQFADDFPQWASSLHVTFTADRANWVSPQNFAVPSDAPGAWLVVHSLADTYVNLRQASDWTCKLKTGLNAVWWAFEFCSNWQFLA